jgi:ATP-dependent DNA helicase 2 subunit 2
MASLLLLSQCLQHRAAHPEDPLPELAPLIARYLERPKALEAACEASAEKICKAFKLERVERQKEEKTGEAMFKEK